MKISKSLLSALLLICLFSVNGVAQEFLQNHKILVKTNVLIDKEDQQWMLTAETKTKKLNQSNSFTVGYEYTKPSWNLNKKEGAYLAYRRVFYSQPMVKCVYFFISPYSKILHRKVFEAEVPVGWYTSYRNQRNFTSNSLILGGDAGIQVVILKRITLSYMMGIGGGFVLNYKSNINEGPNDSHFDGQVAIQLGYVF